MPKNIVICADGTGNKFSDNNTNVVRLYSVLDLCDSSRQIAYYHGGLGTMGDPSALSQLSKRWTRVKGLAFGYGLTDAIADCYSFLMDTFEPDDKVYLFGFSRGSYTVRALSGMLQMFGLIRPKDYNLIGYATQMLKCKQSSQSFQVASEFKKTFTNPCHPYFIGVWDTVSSVGWIWDPLHVPYTAKNPSLSIGRHAVAIDERRCFFRQNLWGPPLPGQDIKQVWFAGVHSDVGGGYPEAESGLAKVPFEWMLCEAQKAGLIIDEDKAARVLGCDGGGGISPDAGGCMHNSLKGAWVLLEPLPHRYIDMSTASPKTSVMIPFGRHRHIEPGIVVHESVNRRIALDKSYRPGNLPPITERSEEPWVRWSRSSAAGAS